MLKLVFYIFIVAVITATIYQFIPEQAICADCTIDSILVKKKDRKLLAFSSGRLIKEYTISLGKQPIGHKQYEGDGKTPEGKYFITTRSASSNYHKNLGISYPNARDRATAKKLNKSPGGDVKIHGLKNGSGYIGRFQRLRDWTNGCIGLTDSEIDELFERVQNRCPILILP